MSCQWIVLEDGRLKITASTMGQTATFLGGREGEDLLAIDLGRVPANEMTATTGPESWARERSDAENKVRMGVQFLQGKKFLHRRRYDEAFSLLKEAADSGTTEGGAEIVLAYAYSTCEDRRYRNGEEAVKYALKAVDQQEWWRSVEALGDAYAEAGDFDKAVESISRARTLFLEQNFSSEQQAKKEEISGVLQQRIQKYTKKQRP